jgi:glycine/D-amino acid oxidase-like deaminating enzyme
MADTSKSNSTTTTTKNKKEEPPRQHGVKGVYYAGEWLDIEYCDGKFNASERSCSGCDFKEACPRSLSRNAAAAMNGSSTKQQKEQKHVVYDVLIVGAGCIGAAIARELSRYQLTVLWVEAADDVSQGATKGNSGIVHAGYDDTPGSNRAKYCWSGNQMFAQLDMELRFGYQKNGSLVVAVTADETKVLEELKRRGETNGVKRLRIIQQKELREMEPYIHPNAIAALYSPDAGNVIPYEFAIALAENAVDNGVELRIRRQVSEITVSSGKEDTFKVLLKYWEPKEFVTHVTKSSAKASTMFRFGLLAFGGGMIALQYLAARIGWIPSLDYGRYHIVGALAVLWLLFKSESTLFPAGATGSKVTKSTTLKDLVEKAGQPDGGTSSSSSSGKSSNVKSVTIEDMLVGGSGSSQALEGIETGKEYVHAKFIINCAGGASDRVAGLIGDDSFQIKPRVGDYILLHRDQVRTVQYLSIYLSLLFEPFALSNLASALPKKCAALHLVDMAFHSHTGICASSHSLYVIFSTGTLGKTHALPVSRPGSRERSTCSDDSVGESNSWSYS